MTCARCHRDNVIRDRYCGHCRQRVRRPCIDCRANFTLTSLFISSTSDTAAFVCDRCHIRRQTGRRRAA